MPALATCIVRKTPGMRCCRRDRTQRLLGKQTIVFSIEHLARIDKALSEALPRVLRTACRPEERGQLAPEEENTIQW